MRVKPSILPGFMELLPLEQICFNKMLDIIRKSYEDHGFLPIESPIIERKEVLFAKGGGETEKQIYEIESKTRGMALRFDLTVPLARYVAEHYSDLTFPFRRYQIGKVYRGERNQRGRYREFYQCDIDIVGNNSLSLVNDGEIPYIIYKTFKNLGFDEFTIYINNRKLLNGFFDYLKIDDKAGVLRTIDKLDKIGLEKVREELLSQGLSKEKIEEIEAFININGSNDQILSQLKELNIENDLFKLGLEELEEVTKYIRLFGLTEENFQIDIKIARGLDYYTGTVYETFLDKHKELGSICSGGRYDDLASNYTSQALPGVGISIGFTRLFYQLMEADLIKIEESPISEVLVIAMEGYLDQGIELVSSLRKNSIKAQVYTEAGKMGRKFSFADKLHIPYVIVLGENEIKSSRYTLRDMKTGEQEEYDLEGIIKKLKS